MITGSAANRLTLVGSTPTIAMEHTKASISAGISGTQGMRLTGAANQVLHLTGSVANDDTGVTRVSGGELRLAKSSGVTSIADDILIDGGILRWGTANQVAGTASITLNAGTLWLAGNTDTVKNLTLNGGTNNGGSGSNGGTFTVTDTLTVSATSSALGLNSAAKWSVEKLVLNGTGAGSSGIKITGNATTAISTLTVGAGGMELHSRHITLNTGSTTNGVPVPNVKGSQIVLNGDVLSSGQVTIQRSGSGVGQGIVDLGATTRVWEVALLPEPNATVSDVKLGVSVVGTGGLTKTGAGILTLGAVSGNTDANTYTGMTTVAAGTLRLSKVAGVDAIAGDVTVQTGALLDWSVGNQLKDSGSIYLQGGALSFKGHREVFANLYQSAGTVNHNFNTVSGEVEITGEAVLTGGEGIVLNSSAQWIVNRVEATATKTGNVIGLNGNSTERMNRFTVGSGGLTLHHNHTITHAKALNVDAFGNELVLNGSFIANGSVSVKVSNSSGNGVAQLNLNGGQRTFQVTNANHTATLNAAVVSTTVTPSGAGATATLGGIIKTGAGTLTLAQANTYGGNTRIEAGTLRVASTGSLAVTPKITVAQGAAFDIASVNSGFTLASQQTLEGGGQVRGAFTLGAGATLRPGELGQDLTQTLAFSAGLTLLNGSSTLLDLGNGGDHDVLSVAGNFNQANGAKILVAANGFTAVEGASFQRFDVDGSLSFSSNLGSLLRSGAEDNGSDFDLPDLTALGMSWDLSQLQSQGIISIVPEPSKASFLLAGLLGWMVRRRR